MGTDGFRALGIATRTLPANHANCIVADEAELTFAVLLLVFHATVSQFRTGWFIESLVTQILMIFMVRTRRWFFASRPSPAVIALAAGAAFLTIILPFPPGGAVARICLADARLFRFPGRRRGGVPGRHRMGEARLLSMAGARHHADPRKVSA